MTQLKKSDLIQDIVTKIFTNVNRLIKGNTTRDRLLNIVDSTFVRVVDTAANFTANNPILGDGEIGVESDSLLTSPKFKIGDGSTSWNSLPYANVSLSGLTTNKVLKATSSTTAGDSNITDSSTTTNSTISLSDGQINIIFNNGTQYGYYTVNGGGIKTSFTNGSNSGMCMINPSSNNLTHSVKNTFDAPLHEFDNMITIGGLTAATENYVNNLIAGLKFKVDVVAASTFNIDINDSPNVFDGIILTGGERVLVKNQTNPTENGCYIFNGVHQPLTRADDSDKGAKLVSATYPVSGGTTNQDTWFTVTNDSITLGSTNIVITQTAGSGTYTVGSYLKLIGNVFDIDFTTFSTTQIKEGSKLFFTDARVLTAPLTGFASAAGTITAADTILSAINKLDGNMALKADITYVDDVTPPSAKLFNYYNFS